MDTLASNAIHPKQNYMIFHIMVILRIKKNCPCDLKALGLC